MALAEQPNLAATPPLVVVIIGMRGAGKTTLGSKASQLLGWPFSDLDEIVAQANNGRLPPQIVEEQGWDAFRQLELRALEDALSSSGASMGLVGAASVVACGGGVVETERGMELLERHWPVVMVDPLMDDVLQRLERNAQQVHRAPLGEDLRHTFLRRLPRYRKCADIRFPVGGGDTDEGALARTLARQLQRLLTGAGASVHLVPDTFAVAFNLPDYAQAPSGLVREASVGADVVELRVDLLASLEHDFVAQQVAIVRQQTSSTPLLFTVRSADHGGRFIGPEQEYFALLRLGLALGVELLDVECTWTPECIQELTSCRHASLLVGSHFDMARQMPDREDVYAAFKRCTLEGAASICRVVLHGRTREQNLLVQHMGNAAASPGTVFVGLCAGKEGRLSCLLNQVLCPATHPRLAPAEPGYLTIEEIMRCRRTLSLSGLGKHFPVLGPWGSAVLPRLLAQTLQSAFLGAEEPRPSSSVQAAEAAGEVHRLLSLASVGGAVLLGQAQQSAVSLLDHLSDEAASVGAVDCVVRREDGTLHGESALTWAVLARLEAVGLREQAKSRVALVVGSGPSSRVALAALKALGFGQVLRANTVSFAQEVEHFPSYTVTLDKSNGDPLGVEISHNHGPMLRVERVTGGLVQGWNAANRGELEVKSGDCIVAVNGAVGEVAKLVEQCGSNQLLQVRLLRKAVASVASEPLADLTALAALSQLDVVIVADLPAEGCSHVKGAQWLASTLGRFKPVVVDMCWPPRHVCTPGSGPELLEAARAADCGLIEAAELLQEQACACMAAWTGQEMLVNRLAKVLCEAVSKVQSI